MWRLRPTWPAAEPGAQQQLRRAQGAAGDDRRAAGAHRVRRGGGRCLGRQPGDAAHADRAPVLDQDAARLDPGAHPGPGGDGARQVADVHAALGVDLAAERAGAALDAVAGVARDRAAGGADRRGALHRELAVAPHPLGVERGDAQELLGLGEVGVEVAGPLDAEAAAPALQHRLGGAEAGAGVDHRGAADRSRRPAPGSAGDPRRSSGRRRGRGRRSPRAGRSGSCRGRSCSPASSTITSSPASASVAAATAPPAPEPTMTTSHSSPSPVGSRCRPAARPAPAASRRRGGSSVSTPIRSSTCGSTA